MLKFSNLFWFLIFCPHFTLGLTQVSFYTSIKVYAVKRVNGLFTDIITAGSLALGRLIVSQKRMCSREHFFDFRWRPHFMLNGDGKSNWESTMQEKGSPIFLSSFKPAAGSISMSGCGCMDISNSKVVWKTIYL